MSRLRNGKIARLPHGLRELLNLRLFDREPASAILPWLNSLPNVKDLLDREFDGAEINAQNLSDWRNGGYNDWLFSQQRLNQVRSINEEAEALRETVQEGELVDSVATVVTGALLRMIHDLTQVVDAHDPAQQQILLKAAGQIERFQRLSFDLRKLQFQREKWLASQAQAASPPVRDQASQASSPAANNNRAKSDLSGGSESVDEPSPHTEASPPESLSSAEPPPPSQTIIPFCTLHPAFGNQAKSTQIKPSLHQDSLKGTMSNAPTKRKLLAV